MVDEVRWIESAGGPLVVVPSSKTHSWHGVDAEDYADACDTEGYTGILDRPWGRILVLNDEPLRTAVVQGNNGVAIVRWLYAPGANFLVDAAANFDARSTLPVERLRITFLRESHAILDSGAVGRDAEQLTLEPPPWTQVLATYVIKLGEELGFVLHRFEDRATAGLW